MKNSIIITATLFLSILFITSCDKDDTTEEALKYEYHAHLMTPDNTDKMMGDSLNIKVHFESHTGETVHNVNVTITEKDGGKVVYSKPDESHSHSKGELMFTDAILLDASNGFNGHTDYVLVAKVWGHEDGEEEASETVEFHVHP